MSTELKSYSFVPQNYDQAFAFASMIAESSYAPKEMKGKPGDIFITIQLGSELGLQPMQALQNIAVINGRPSVWGDAVMGIVRSHPECEYITESFDLSTMTAKCSVKRKGALEEIRFFSQEDAQTAGLWGKQGPWKQYPKRMLQMRARGFCVRDTFADALKGISFAEESRDTPKERDITPAQNERADLLKSLAVKEKQPVTLQAVEQPEKEPVVIVQDKPEVELKPEGGPTQQPDIPKYTFAQLANNFNNCQDMHALETQGEHLKASIGLLPDDQQDELKELYIGRVKELQPQKKK